MKVRRYELAAGGRQEFTRNLSGSGVLAVYITRGKHPELRMGLPVSLEPGETYVVTTEQAIQVSCIHDD